MGNRVIAAKLLKIKKRKRQLPRALRMDVIKTGHFNPHAPGAEVFRRKFDPPDAAVMERNVANTIAAEAMVIDDKGNIHRQKATDGVPGVYNSVAHAKAWADKVPQTRVPNRDNAEGKFVGARPEFYDPKLDTEMVLGQAVVETMHPSLDNEGFVVKERVESVMFKEWSNWRRQGKTYFIRQNVITSSVQVRDLWFYGDKVYFIEKHILLGEYRISMNYRNVRRAMLENNHDSIRWVEHIPIESS